jgi:hypothetical protein
VSEWVSEWVKDEDSSFWTKKMNGNGEVREWGLEREREQS